GQLAAVVRYVRAFRRAADGDAVADAQLLEHFVRDGDELAFAALLRRHGPMVLGVCRRLLRHEQEAEDAFQAAFLLLIRKARSLPKPQSVGAWRSGVAYRTALKARALASRRRAREIPADDLPATPTADELARRDLRALLDEAINRLPSKYRMPFVLCYLDGM